MLKLCLSLLLSAGFIFQWILLWLIFSNFIWFLLIWSFFFQRFINKCANFFFFYIIASHCGRRCHHFCAGPNGKKPSHEMTWCWHLWKYKEFILSFWANHIATGRKAAAAKKRHIPVQKSIWMNVNICWATALVSVIHRFATCVLIWP